MKIINRLFTTLLVTTLLIGCKEQNEITEVLAYPPIEIGNSWEYTATQQLKNISYSNDSLIGRFDSIITNDITIRVEDTITNDGVKFFQISIKQGSLTSYQYIVVDDSGLKGYNLGAGLDIDQFFPNNSYDFFCHNPFDKNAYGQSQKSLIKKSSAIPTELPLILKYPLIIGESWSVDELSKTEKTVSEFSQISVGSNTFDCFKIDYKFYNNTNASTIDYISSCGLVKRTRLIKNVNLGYNCYGDYYENINIENYNLMKK